MSDALTDLIISYVPEDGSSIGNGAMMARLREQMPSLSDEDYFAARDALVDEGILGRGRGRGGSVHRADISDLELTAPEMTESAPAAKAARKKASRKSDEPTQVLAYR